MRVMRTTSLRLLSIGLCCTAGFIVACAGSPPAGGPSVDDTSSAEAREEEEGPIVVEDGRTISIEYTLKLADGTVADTSEGREPLSYEQGGQQILPALEHELAGMRVGEEKNVTVTPEEGYGLVDENLMQEVPSDQIPKEAHHEGAQLMTQDPQGNQRVVKVHEVKEETIVVDLNHPLAGETLYFDVKVVGIE
jgi:FKBP-type peptidyl-prolyl cis-trans isomerase SlyD